MTEQEIMQLAKEAGFGVGEHNGEVHVLTPVYEDLSIAEYIKRFATLVAEREREACAKVCESIFTNGDAAEGWLYIAADKIRARGEKDGA